MENIDQKVAQKSSSKTLAVFVKLPGDLASLFIKSSFRKTAQTDSEGVRNCIRQALATEHIKPGNISQQKNCPS